MSIMPGTPLYDAVMRRVKATQTAPAVDLKPVGRTHGRPTGQSPLKIAPVRKSAADRQFVPPAPELPLGRVMAFDPSMTNFGWALLESVRPGQATRIASGALGPKANKAKCGTSTRQLVAFLIGLVKEYGRPNHVVFEIHSGNTAYAMKGMSAARYGRAVQAAEDFGLYNGIPTFEVEVLRWKGYTSKAYTMGLMEATYRHKPASEDEADALGIGTWFVNTDGGQDARAKLAAAAKR